jgi:hypothetical protein
LAFCRLGIAGVAVRTSNVKARVQHEARSLWIAIQGDQVLLGERLHRFELRERRRPITEDDGANRGLCTRGPCGDLVIARRRRLEGASFAKDGER